MNNPKLYLTIITLTVVFALSIISIQYVQNFLNQKEEEEKLDKYVSFFLPTTALISFFLACFFVSQLLNKSNLAYGMRYVGIYFILLITTLLFIFNNTVLEDKKVREYIKGRKFSIVGLIMISGVSALVFGFIDNFGLSIGMEALDHKFLQLFLGPFSTDRRFIPEKKSISRNLVSMNNWAQGKWRSVINHTLRFKEDIRKMKGTEDLMNDIDNLVKRDGGRPLEIPDRIKREGLVEEYIKNIKSKYDIIESSKAMISNSFSNFIGAVLGAAIVNLFTYVTKYDKTYSGDEDLDESFWVKKINNYVPLLEGGFMIIGCFIPILLNIALKRDSHNHNNRNAYLFLSGVALLLLSMLYLSVKSSHKMKDSEKKKSVSLTLLDMVERLDINPEENPDLYEKIKEFRKNL